MPLTFFSPGRSLFEAVIRRLHQGMKALALLLILLSVAFSEGRAATVYGTVYSSGSSRGVPNQKVYIRDTVANYFDSTHTNASGGFYFALSAAVHTNDVVEVYTWACGTVFSNSQVFHGSSYIANLTICAAYSLSGTVTLNGSSINGQARLFLLSRSYDSARRDTITSVVDTILTDGSAGNYSRSYSSIPSGNLLLKAELLTANASYGRYLPTWYGGSLVWSNAQPLSASNFSISNATVINLIPATPSSGYASASGIVKDTGHAAGRVSKPLAGRLLLLTNAIGEPVGFRISDSIGRFNFGSLALGTYKMFGDSWGRINPALTFTLTATYPNLADIVFIEDSTSFYGSLTSDVGIASSGTLNAVQVMPNPVDDVLQLCGLSGIEGPFQVRVLDMAGRTMTSMESTQQDEIRLDVHNLPAGVYMLELRAAGSRAVFRVVKL